MKKPLLLILWMCLCLSGKQADLVTTSQSPSVLANNVVSASLSDVVVMSALTSAAVKRCLELEPRLVFQLIETKVRHLNLNVLNLGLF